MTENTPATPSRAGLGTDVPKTPPRTTTTLQPPTPVAVKTASSQPYTSTHAERDENITNMWHEISGKIVGPMPANIFLQKFVSPAASLAPGFDKDELDELMEVKVETRMYDHIVNNRYHCSSFLITDPC